MNNKKICKSKKYCKRYEVDESILNLIQGLEVLLNQVEPSLPLEYKKLGYEYLNKMIKLAGLSEKQFEDCDIDSYKYVIEITYKETDSKE